MKRSYFHYKRTAILTVICVLLPVSNHSLSRETSPFDFKGYAKSFNVLLAPPDLLGGASPYRKAEYVSLNTLRTEFKWRASKDCLFHAAYSLLPGIGTFSSDAIDGFLPGPDPFNYRFADIRGRLLPPHKDSSGKFTLRNNIDRFYFSYSASFGDLIVGRQPIAFGYSRFSSPTDILSPFTLDELDKEERVGVDALRYTLPIGKMGEFDMGWVFGKNSKLSKSAAFTKIKAYAYRTDFEFITALYRNNVLLGFNIARNIGGAGAWVEGAYTLAGVLAVYKPQENYFRLSVGADYNFADNLYAYVEYHYNGAGKTSPRDYVVLYEQTAYAKGSVYLLGMHYISMGSRYEITPLWNLNTNFVFNANDQSLFLVLRFEYNVMQNIYIDICSYFTMGRLSQLTEDHANPIVIGSEFGIYPDLYYAALRFYF